MREATPAVRRWLLVVCHFVCPLVFFTNLTRNPYLTQIGLLYAGIAMSLAAWAWAESGRPEGWAFPRLTAAAPLGLFAILWALSWLRAYAVHPPFFRPAMLAEGARGGCFLLVVCASTFVVSSAVAATDEGGAEVPLGGWAAFALAWGLAWTAFGALRAPASGRPEEFWPLIRDPYGAFLWVAGLAVAARLTRRGRVADFLHLALCAGFLASAYGVAQYFNLEFIWPYTLNPYGGRAVSTFGNPNFLSTYDVALMPIALALFLTEKPLSRRLSYAAVFLVLEAALLATLTRSSWLGAVVACGALSLSPRVRARLREEPRAAGLIAAAAAALALLWPSSSIATGYTPTVVGRLTEFSALMKRTGSYSPFHQRVLIWASAWLMGSESPWTGKGGGLFELFYPFYQGTMLHGFVFFHTMRTHANNAHNELLETFAQTGLLGLGAFAAFWVSFFESARRWAKGRIGDDPLWAGAVAGCAGVLADNMLNVSLHFAVPAFLFWWLAGVAVGRGAREVKPRYWKAPAAARRAAFSVIALFAASTTWLQARMLMREAWYFAGFKMIRLGDLAGAARALERSRASGPREVNALYELGNAYARVGRWNDAADAYRQALGANAGYDEIYYNLGTVYNAHLARPDLALGFYQTAWAINPLSNDLCAVLASFYLRGPRPDIGGALEVLTEAVRDFPDNPNHWSNLGLALASARRWPEAESAYARALAIAPDMAAAENGLSAVAARSGRPRPPILAVLADLRSLDAAVLRRDYSDRTVALAGSVARRAPDVVKGRFLYGSLLLARGRPAEAVPELEAVVAREPGRAVGRVNLGSAYLALGRSAEAEAQFRAALAADPGNSAAMERLKSMGAIP